LYKQAARHKHLQVKGVSVHIGSQITDASPFGAAMRRIAELVSDLRAEGHDIEYVDAGGGLGINYGAPEEIVASVADYAKALTSGLGDLRVKLLLEPGRAIVGAAGVLLTRVLYRKTNGDKRFVVVDAAMNDLVRPSLYRAEHQIASVRKSARASETVDVVGPVCESGDFLARDRELPMVKPGELLAVLDAGAYGMTLASNYNTRPRPAEILVNGKIARVIRKRETIQDLLRLEN
jgi:diaminopimelate decarboxylase